MFRLSDATRRLITTGLFVLLCVVPTVVVIAVGLWRSLPGRVAAEERRLTLLLGQPVQIESVRVLRPGAALYEGLEIRDPESNAVLVRCDRLRVRSSSFCPKGGKQEYPQLQLSAGTLTVMTPAIDPLRPMVDRLLQRRIRGAPPYAVLTAKHLVLRCRQSELRADRAEAWVTLRSEKSVVDLNLQLEGREEAKPVHFSIARDREYEPVVDGFVLEAQETPLPCPILATVMPPFPDLGENSSFQGTIIANHVPEDCRLNGDLFKWHGWELRVEGALQNVELGKLAGSHISYEISGIGTLRLKELVCRAGRVRSMIGDLRARDGRVSRELIASCVKELNFRASPPISGPRPLPYSELAVSFQLDGQGLALLGQCSGEPSGALLLGNYIERVEPPDPAYGLISPTKAVAAIATLPNEDPYTAWRRAFPLLKRMPEMPKASATIAAPAATPGGAYQR